MISGSFDDEIEKSTDPYFLVRLLLDEGDELSEKLRKKILSMGAAAVPPLINMLNNEALQMERAPGGGSGPIHAVDLLADLNATEAIEPMLRWLAETDPTEDILPSRIMTALSRFGEAAYLPVLKAFDQAKDIDHKKYLCDIMTISGVRNDRIFNIILDLFEAEPDYGATCFALYGDPKALDHLHRALAKCDYQDESENLFANQLIIDLSNAIKELGGAFTPEETEKLKKVHAQRDRNADRIEALFDQVENKTRSPQHKPGRNDPCWCGSGKKYKHCHWQRDRSMN